MAEKTTLEKVLATRWYGEPDTIHRSDPIKVLCMEVDVLKSDVRRLRSAVNRLLKQAKKPV